MLRFLLVILAALSLHAEPDWRDMLRQSFVRLQASEERQKQWTYFHRSVRKELNSDGSVKSENSMLYRREVKDGAIVQRLVERNGAPISDVERKKLEESANQSRKDNRARTRGDDAGWEAEFPEAFNYQLLGEEAVAGRKTWVVACEPKPGYKAKNMRAKVFEKLRGKVWIDQVEHEIVRAEAEIFENLSVGFGVLGKIDKGTRFSMRRTRMEDGSWLLADSWARFAVRIMLVKYMFNEVSTENWNFQPHTKLASVGR